MDKSDGHGCCQCDGIRQRFDEAYVSRKVHDYQLKGPNKTTTMLVEAIKTQGVSGLTVLDIGGGVGGVVHGLLEAGVDQATNVEASEAYAAAFLREAERLGNRDRVQVYSKDFIAVAPQVSTADIVTLDRVVCCYHDFQSLIGQSLQKCRRYYGLVYPQDSWWVKITTAIFYNLRHWLVGSPFRNYIHSNDEVGALIESRGFHSIFHKLVGAWQVVVYAKG